MATHSFGEDQNSIFSLTSHVKVSFAFIVVAAVVVVVVVLGGVNAPSCVLEKYKCNRSRVLFGPHLLLSVSLQCYPVIISFRDV